MGHEEEAIIGQFTRQKSAVSKQNQVHTAMHGKIE
jgi:hypothetical protein